MRKFLVRTLLFSIPVFAILVGSELLLRNIPNDYSYKNDYLSKNAQNIESLFLGNSHVYYGINPDYISGKSFNASHISQTIDLDYALLKKYSKDLTSLKTLIIPIDYFSLFSRTSTGIEAWRMKNYNIYYNLNTSFNLKDNSEVLSFSVPENVERIKNYYYLDKSNITCSQLGYGNIPFKQFDLVETGKLAAERHTEESNKYLAESIDIIDQMISFAEKNDISILFFTSPTYETYYKQLDKYQYNTTINSIDSICSNHSNSHYFNLISDDRFVAKDFRDADHLNQEGAQKLSQIINEKMLAITKKD